MENLPDESKARLLENRWQALLDAAVDAIIIIDAKGRIQLMNKAAENMFLCRMDKALDKNISIFMPAPFKAEHDQYIKNYLQSGKSKVIGSGRYTKGLKADGTVFPIHLSVGEVNDSNSRQFIAIIRDISEQEQYRTELQDMREKLSHAARINAIGEMVAEVTHELNQPITAIDSYAQASINLAKHDSALYLHDIADIQYKIGKQVNRAKLIQDKLRRFLKKRNGHRQVVKIDDIIEDAIEFAKLDARFVHHQIILESQTYPCALVYVEAVQIQQVLLNLIRNGLEAMHAKAGALYIASYYKSPDMIEVRIRDHGNGLNKAIKDTLFDPFVSTKSDGMGLGLAVCQSIVHAYGGEMYVESNSEGGATFMFSLPTHSSDNLE